MPPVSAAIAPLIVARICAWVEPGNLDTRIWLVSPWQSWQLSGTPWIMTFCTYSVAPLTAFPCANALVALQAAIASRACSKFRTRNNVWRLSIGGRNWDLIDGQSIGDASALPSGERLSASHANAEFDRYAAASRSISARLRSTPQR